MSETVTDVATQGTAEAETAPQPANDIAPAPGTEQQAEPTQEVETEPKPKQTPWFQRRIDELTREKHEARRQVEAANEALRKIQQSGQSQPKPQQPPAGFVPASEVDRIAAKFVEEQSFVQACNDVFDAGTAKNKDFSEAVETFRMLGGTPPAFLEAVTALGKEEGAKVYYDLGKNPDEASRILQLPPVKMAMELQRLAARAPKPVQTSRAPAPIDPISASTVRNGAEPDAKDIKAWTAWFNEKRSAKR